LIVCRIIGWIFILAALAIGAYEVIELLKTGSWRLTALGEVWFKLHRASLNGAQAGIQRYVAPWLWEPVITTILLWPGWLVFGVPGGLLVLVCRRRKRFVRMPRRLK
jgi:hypothetical protein